MAHVEHRQDVEPRPDTDGVMTQLRSAALATVLCGTVVLAGWAVSGLTGFDSPRIEKPNLAPIEDQRAASLSAKTQSVSANTESVDAPQPAAIDKTGTSTRIW